jgi:hypothetical protein
VTFQVLWFNTGWLSLGPHKSLIALLWRLRLITKSQSQGWGSKKTYFYYKGFSGEAKQLTFLGRINSIKPQIKSIYNFFTLILQQLYSSKFCIKQKIRPTVIVIPSPKLQGYELMNKFRSFSSLLGFSSFFLNLRFNEQELFDGS